MKAVLSYCVVLTNTESVWLQKHVQFVLIIPCMLRYTDKTSNTSRSCLLMSAENHDWTRRTHTLFLDSPLSPPHCFLCCHSLLLLVFPWTSTHLPSSFRLSVWERFLCHRLQDVLYKQVRFQLQRKASKTEPRRNILAAQPHRTWQLASTKQLH